MPNTPKTNHNNTRTSKKQTQKTPFCHGQKQPTIFHKFSVFSTYHFCFWKAVFYWKHYKNSVFSKTQLFKNTVSKTHFFTHVKKHLFQRKGVIFGFGKFPLKPLFLLFFLVYTVLVKKILAKTDSVHENVRFFSLPDTNSVRQVLLKIHFFDFSHFWMTTLKNLFL